jgi:hypothetical protein
LLVALLRVVANLLTACVLKHKGLQVL